jgi:hypothetical protein
MDKQIYSDMHAQKEASIQQHIYQRSHIRIQTFRVEYVSE